MERIVPWVIGFVMAGLLYGFITGSIQERKEWEAFKLSHACKVVGKIKESMGVGNGIGGNGQVTMVVITNPSQTGWQCNDGVTYWRED